MPQKLERRDVDPQTTGQRLVEITFNQTNWNFREWADTEKQINNSRPSGRKEALELPDQEGWVLSTKREINMSQKPRQQNKGTKNLRFFPQIIHWVGPWKDIFQNSRI